MTVAALALPMPKLMIVMSPAEAVGIALRYVFDEGHHVFDAADSAFSAEFSGGEGSELRRWLLGAEGGRSRARGLRRRLEELVAVRGELHAPLEAALQAARALPGPGWLARLTGTEEGFLDPGAPDNPTEIFLKLRWPAAIPMLFSSLKVSISISLVGAIVGELPTGAQAGIGARLLSGSYYGQTVQIWSALVMSALLGLALTAAMAALETAVLGPRRRA